MGCPEQDEGGTALVIPPGILEESTGYRIVHGEILSDGCEIAAASVDTRTMASSRRTCPSRIRFVPMASPLDPIRLCLCSRISAGKPLFAVPGTRAHGPLLFERLLVG